MKDVYKIGFVGDVHDDINPMIQEQVVPALKTVIDQAIERKLDALVFLGDLTVKRGYLPPDVATRLRTQIERAARAGIKVKLFPGNHDYSIRGGADNVTAIFSIEENGSFRSIMENIEVITRPTVIDLGAIELAIVPYPNKYNLALNLEDCKDSAAEVSKRLPVILQALAAQLSDKKPAILCTHLNIVGSETDSEQVMPAGLDIEINAGEIPHQFALCMNGHLHKRQKIEQGPGDPLIIMPGCIAPLQYSTRPQKHFWDMLDLQVAGAFIRHEIAIPVQHPLVTAKVDDDYQHSMTSITTNIIEDTTGLYDASSHLKLAIKCAKAKLDLINRPTLESELKKYFYSASVTYERTDSDDARSAAITLESSLEGQLQEWAKINGVDEARIEELQKLAVEIEAKLPADQVAAFRARNYKPVRLWWQNYKPLGSGEIVFDNLGRLTCIYGPNTLGKSNISELEAFAIWKAILRGGTLADIPRLAGDGRAVVGIEFEAAGRTWKIERSVTLTKSAAKSEMIFSRFVDPYGAGDWEIQNSGDQAGTQAEIERLCGSLDLYLATRYASQFDIDRLMKMKPAELKDTLQASLNTGVFDVRNATGRELQNSTKREMEGLTRDQATQEQLAQDQATAAADEETARTSLKNNRASLEAIDELIANITEEGNGLKITRDTLKEKADRRSAACQKLCEANNILTATVEEKIQLTKERDTKSKNASDIPGRRKSINDRIDAIKKEYLALDGKENELTDESDKITQKIMDLQEQRRTLSNQDEAFEKTINDHQSACKEIELTQSTLKTQLLRAENDSRLLETVGCKDSLLPCPLLENAQAAAGHVKNINSALATYDVQVTVILTEINNAVKDRQAIKSLIQDLDKQNMKLAEERNLVDQKARELKTKGRGYQEDITRANKEIEGLNDLEKSLADIGSKISAAEAKIDVLTTVAAERQKEYEACPDVDLADIDQQLAAVREKWTKASDGKKSISNEISLMQEAIGRCSARIEAAAAAAGKVMNIEARILNLQNETALMEIYLRATSRDGIPYLLLERSLPRMRDIVNGYLENTMEAERFVRIDIASIAESKSSGRSRNEVTITFTDEKGTHPITEVSGYQRMAIGGALRAALAKVQAEATGAEINLFWQDEGFAASDKDNLMGCQQMLLKIAKDFGKVIYISHQDEMKEVAHTLVKVIGDPDSGTKIEIIN